MKNVIIIAEAGVNHNGNKALAKQLIDAAAKTGADYIKFQTFITELIVDKSAPKAEYQNASVGLKKSQFEMIKELELSFDDFLELRDHCIKKNIKFLTTVADLQSLGRLDELNVDFIKISSGEIANPLFLKAVSKKRKPILLSTGMSNLGEIEEALTILTSNGLTLDDITVLHCNTEYPTPMEDVNLKAMNTISDAFKIKVGYSDHTLGIEIPIAAVARGAKVIEKHFTLDKRMEGPDHSSSLEPAELTEMVRCIRSVEQALRGSGRKEPSKSELKNIPIVRKSIFISEPISKGQLFSDQNITVKRPGDGIPSIEVQKIIGKSAACDLKKGDKLKYENISW
jgi:N,N'-diacetyllegionaminate synthase